MNVTIRKVYLYLTSLIGLVLILIGAITLVNLGLKTWIFTKADNEFYGSPCYEPQPVKDGETTRQLSKEDCDKQQVENRTARRQSDAARSIAFILVGVPVYLYHWRKIKDERDVQAI